MLIRMKKEQLLSSTNDAEKIKQIVEEYKIKDQKVKRRCKEDK